MYYVMRASAPSLHRESTDSLINLCGEMSAMCKFRTFQVRIHSCSNN